MKTLYIIFGYLLAVVCGGAVFSSLQSVVSRVGGSTALSQLSSEFSVLSTATGSSAISSIRSRIQSRLSQLTTTGSITTTFSPTLTDEGTTTGTRTGTRTSRTGARSDGYAQSPIILLFLFCASLLFFFAI